MQFKNTKEMEMVFSKILPNVVDGITTQMKYRMQDEIEKQGIGSDGEVYKSTGEFQRAWINEKSMPTLKNKFGYEGEMHYEPDLIKTHNSDEWQHMSGIKDWQDYDIDKALPYFLFEEGVPKKLWGETVATKPRDAWTPFLRGMNRSFTKITREEFAKQGIKLDTSKNGNL